MEGFDTKEWMVLNSIIYNIYTESNMDKMRYNFLEKMKNLIDFDGADFYLSDGNNEKLAHPVSYGYDCDEELYIDDMHYSIQVVISYKKRLLGKIALYRSVGKENFKYEDIFILDMMKEHLAFRLGRNEDACINSGKLTICEAVEKFGLTKREHTILGLLLKGFDNDTISSQLQISVNTLKKHILNIYRKMGIRNRVSMFKMVMERE